MVSEVAGVCMTEKRNLKIDLGGDTDSEGAEHFKLGQKGIPQGRL